MKCGSNVTLKAAATLSDIRDILTTDTSRTHFPSVITPVLCELSSCTGVGLKPILNQLHFKRVYEMNQADS